MKKAAHEAELARQENIRMEMEKKEKDELARTFNGVVYESIEAVKAAKEKYDEQLTAEKNSKKVDRQAVWCLVLSIATWPLLMTGVLWLPSLIVSIVMGIKAMRQNTKKKKSAIAGLALDLALAFIFALAVLAMVGNS